MTENRQPKFFYGYVVVVAGFIILVLMYGTLYSFGVFFKPVLTEFGWTRAMTSGAYSLCFLLSGAVAMLTGRLNDRFGPRMVMAGCGLLLGLGYLLMPQISAIWQLYLFYGVIIGMGMSGGVTPSLSTVARWFVKRRGLMTGIAVAGIGAGTLIMPPIANWLISIYSWRTSFTIIGIVVLVLIVGLAQLLRRDPGKMGLLPYGASAAVEDRLSLGTVQEAIRTRQCWMLFTIYICAGFFIQIIIVHIVIHTTGLGISAASAAVVISIVGGGNIAGRLIAGGIADRFGNKLTITAALILMVVVFLWLQIAEGVWMFYLFAAIFGLAHGGILCMMSPLTAELFGLRSHGALLGIVMFGSTIGGAIGPITAGRIFDITSSYQMAFTICVAVAVAAVILAIFIRPVYRQLDTK